MKKVGLISLGLAAALFLLGPVVLIYLSRSQLHDTGIEKVENLLPDDPSQRVLVFFPHPDDEITVAGTLMKLRLAGHEVYLVTLTPGEAGSSPEQYSKAKLAEVRTKELNNVARILEVNELFLLDYADGGLIDLGQDSLKSIAMEWIKKLQPQVLLSYDSKVGLYGHADHKLTGLAMEELYLENRGKADFSPQKLYQVTLSPKQIDIALQLSEGFQKNYPKDPAKGLPMPDFSVDVQYVFDRKLEAMKAHHSQRLVLRDLMPFHDQIPAFIYSRIFDREYYREVQ